MGKKPALLLSFVLLVTVSFFLSRTVFFPAKTSSQEKDYEVYQGVSYQAVDSEDFDISVITSSLNAPTRVRLSPNGNRLFASQLTGEVLVLEKKQSAWSEPKIISKVETKFPGFPPEEGGLAGISLSHNFETDGKIFLFYTYKNQDGIIKNRIAAIRVFNFLGKTIATKPKQIFEANADGNASHQITDGYSLDIEGKPHLMFVLGEGFEAERALDPNLEAGKVMLIQHTGEDPLGKRPFEENPRIEAIGIRNAFVLTKDAFDDKGRFIVADTGPSKYDRLIYAKLAQGTPFNFLWDGEESTLARAIPDPTDTTFEDIVISRLPETRTFTGVVFSKDSKIYTTVFGQTGSPSNTPGKEIWEGTITREIDEGIQFKPIIVRAEEAEGMLGNTLGLAYDEDSGTFYFLDIMEGRLYQAKGGDKN